jgi:hypothetical protein
MTRNQAIGVFESEIVPGLCDFAPATLRTAWNDWTDCLAKSGNPRAYDWMYPKKIRVNGKTYRLEAK